jgi:plastocyanin
MKAFNTIKSSIVLLLTVLIFVGCNNQESNKVPTESAEKESHKSQTHIVEIKGMMFEPANLIVHAGDTVIWINKDIVAHDVTEVNKAWASPKLESDSSWKKVITKSDSYYCSIHLVMKGDLTVEE